jgi:hypothetical protein
VPDQLAVPLELGFVCDCLGISAGGLEAMMVAVAAATRSDAGVRA